MSGRAMFSLKITQPLLHRWCVHICLYMFFPCSVNERFIRGSIGGFIGGFIVRILVIKRVSLGGFIGGFIGGFTVRILS